MACHRRHTSMKRMLSCHACHACHPCIHVPMPPDATYYVTSGKRPVPQLHHPASRSLPVLCFRAPLVPFRFQAKATLQLPQVSTPVSVAPWGPARSARHAPRPCLHRDQHLAHLGSHSSGGPLGSSLRPHYTLQPCILPPLHLPALYPYPPGTPCFQRRHPCASSSYHSTPSFPPRQHP